MPKTNPLIEVFKAQLITQSTENDRDFAKLARKRDQMIGRLSTRDRIQLQLASGIVSRLTERRA